MRTKYNLSNRLRIQNMNKKWSLTIIILCSYHALLSMEETRTKEFWSTWNSELAASSATATLVGAQVNTLRNEVAQLEKKAKEADTKILRQTITNVTLSQQRDTFEDDYYQLEQEYKEARFRATSVSAVTTNLISSSNTRDLDDKQCFQLIQALLQNKYAASSNIGIAHEAIIRQTTTLAKETSISASTDVPTSNDSETGKKRINASAFSNLTNHIKKDLDTSRVIGTFQQSIQRWTDEIRAINRVLDTLHNNYPALLDTKFMQIIFSSS